MSRFDFLKRAPLPLIAVLLSAGCASTVESRKRERTDVYSGLAAEMRSLVDQGQIKMGMPMDAVYIAWGKPAQVLTGESAQGKEVIWIYHGTYFEDRRYWAYRDYGSYGPYYASPTFEHESYPRSYVRAEVIFQDGVVKQWRALPRPPDY